MLPLFDLGTNFLNDSVAVLGRLIRWRMQRMTLQMGCGDMQPLKLMMIITRQADSPTQLAQLPQTSLCFNNVAVLFRLHVTVALSS